MRGKEKFIIMLAPILLLMVVGGFEAPDINDAYATESVDAWGYRSVPDLAVTDDAKVGEHGLVGTFGFTGTISLAAGKGRAWNLTRHEKLRFWAKAQKVNQNLLVMLCTCGYTHRRDAVAEVGPEWKLIELPLDEKTFFKNAQGNFDFARIRSILFYNNQGGDDIKLWIDGLELVGEREGRPPKDAQPLAARDESTNVLKLLPRDPFSHLAEAELGRHEAKWRYDLPPIAFNPDNAFEDAVINFDAISDWKAIVRDGNGFLCLSEDQPLRGKPNLKVEIALTGDKPRITLMPPEPITVDKPFDIVECWAYAHKHGGTVAIEFETSDGSSLVAGSDYSDSRDDVNPKPMGQFWTIVRVVLPETVPAGAKLRAIHVTPTVSKRYEEPTYLFHLDQLRVQLFSEYLKQPPPKFDNIGEIVDNFPTRPQGACPSTVDSVTTKVTKQGEAYHLSYDDELSYIYTPQTGTLDDLQISPKGQPAFQPAVGSGPVFEFGDAPAELDSCSIDADAVTAVWRYGDQQTITYRLSLVGKTLRIEADSAERDVTEWRFGKAKGVRDAKIIEVPFMLYSPNVLFTHDLFVTYYSDWYFGNVSQLPNGQNSIDGDEAGYSYAPRGGYSYVPRTDGKRLPFHEVFYITASRQFDDVMLNVANPPSPKKDVLKQRLFRMVGSSDNNRLFERAGAFVELAGEYGMTDIYFLMHAPLFFKRRMGCEGFPGDMNVSLAHAGGDEGLKALFDRMNELGMAPGYYDGFPARDVVSPSFHYDWTTYNADGSWNIMWRCPALKPWAFPEIAATLCRQRAKKFGTRVSYQDGMTSWIFSYMSDFDHRFPESGTLRGTMKALATGWQRSRESVNGPVFSEGRGSDFYTAGLNDGDYSKLKGYWDDKPCNEDRPELFVDFRLKKMGPLSAPVSIDICYAGFAATNKISFDRWYAQKDSYQYLHHFLATQFAFAAIGMLEPYWPLWTDPHTHFDQTMRCYFLTRQLQQRYIMETVKDIRYFDGEKLLDTSAALRADVVKDNRLRIRYENGLVIYINVNWDGKHWQVTDNGKTYDLPPGGWFARQGDEFLTYSAIVDGKRVDHVTSLAYDYHDAGDGQVIDWKQGLLASKQLRYPPQR